MNKTLIALTAAAGFVAAGLAIAPAAAAPIAPKQLSHAYQQAGNNIQQVRHDRRRAHRHVQRHHRFARRHFWAPGPWAFRGHHNCFPVRGGYICYF
jgi:Ni/Co efflux regulator RcnB